MQISGKNRFKKLPNQNGLLRTTFFALFGLVLCWNGNAAIFDIEQLPNGQWRFSHEGTPSGTASTKAEAENLASQLKDKGHQVNWKTTSANSSAGSTPKALPPHNGGKTPKALPEPKPGSNLPATTTKSGSNLPATTTKPGSNLPATTTKPASSSPATTTKPASSSSAKPISTTSAPKVNAGGAVLGVVGTISGLGMVYDSIDAKEEKTTWADVGTGAMGGFTAAAGTTAVVNAIPVVGQIAYGSAMAVGTVLGASGALLKMFSETDCPRDPVTGQLSCCNISNLTNLKGARRAGIGDEMFGEFPYVHTCMQGKNKSESGWLKARFLDDHWSEKGEVKFCSGWVMPVDGDYNIQKIAYVNQDRKTVCWRWECADNGMTRQGGKCVATSDTKGTVKAGGGLWDAPNPSGDAGKELYKPCLPKDLPPHATAGRYVYINAQNPVKCAATECEEGYYLVRNAAGQSQGWCQKGTDPHATTNTSETTSEQGASSSDTSGTDTTGADASAQNQPGGGTSGQVQPTAPVVKKSPCDLGEFGWLVFEGRCITDAEHQNILAERQAAKVRALAQKIESTATQLDSMSSRFKVSVWKDAEGKFNTARLASDSIAGVVLGTAGGLITSHVVKKNQVENGFQDIKCTIGGQSVANWGDEFSVGIQ